MINLYVNKDNAKARLFQELVANYAIAILHKDEVLDPLDREIKKTKATLATMVDDDGIMGQAEYKKNLEKKLAELEATRAKEAKELTFDLGDIPGLTSLYKAWDDCETRYEKEVVIKKFFAMHGLEGPCMEFVDAMGGKGTSSRKTRALHARFSKDRKFNKGVFMSYLVDIYMEAGLIKKDIVPESLRAAFEEDEKQAKARREAKKAEKQANKKNRK